MTLDPFTYWQSLWRTGRAALDTMTKVAETLQATPRVIDSRTRTLAAAASDPLHGDYREISLMGTEKLAAFSQAGLVAFDDLRAIQAQALANWQLAAEIMLKGRPPTAREMSLSIRRSTVIAERAARAGGRALAPIHRGVTANARRLGRAEKGKASAG